MNGQLAGRIAIITGANQGLGLEIAKAYVGEGASLMLCARNADMLSQVETDLNLNLAPGQKIVSHVADVSKEADVKAVAAAAFSELGGCDILVNNAGVYGPKGNIEDVDWSEWVRAMEVNVFGSVMMTRAVLGHFKARGYGKIVQLSGGGATNPLPRISAYATSKAAIVRFAETLAEEVRGTGIDVNCIAPGALNTRMLDEIIEAGPERVGQAFYEKSLKQKEAGGTSLQAGANLAVFLASAKSDGITGKLISAIWDNWENWHEHREELARTDAYTLRRIAGRDRGIDWGDK
ncbi:MULTISPECIES: SDR family oxidoreductase [unclassified Rhizobium]|uniref:SDR family NAD(P)-dependent oxidoreductase n=1 Tax=unclassified Rhizobium TaxID=2613769 RepID=UPI0011605F2F|nr:MULTISPECIES: SDR family oxidoreductase [unclassified Rhizobium]TQX86919.1 SDR family oxidoreductase [Rhizobium sp. rho-13.1]TQY05587.1 SDR family oxidoreductase [Rhizobium sp. rho-1.1]